MGIVNQEIYNVINKRRQAWVLCFKKSLKGPSGCLYCSLCRCIVPFCFLASHASLTSGLSP